MQDLCGLSVEEVLVLKKDYDTVKKAWADKKIDMSNLTNHTTLSEREIISIITCLDNPI